MMLVSKLGIFLTLFAFLQKAQSFDNETLKNFSDFYAYRKVLGKSESADEIARLFVKDSVQGKILKDKKVGECKKFCVTSPNKVG
jgi:hypothetical protein